MAMILEGRIVRDYIQAAQRRSLSLFHDKPCLAIIVVGERPDSIAYVRQKELFGEKVGITVSIISFNATVTTEMVIKEVHRINNDSKIHGCIVQLPLPSHINQKAVIESIHPDKDVDGLTSASLKRLYEGDTTGFIPATARGVLKLLDFYKIPVASKKITVVGRSMLVGRPLALLLLASDATVTVCHSKTVNTSQITRASDIVIVATGKPTFFGREYFAAGQIVIDVGINAVGIGKLDEEISERRLVGDVAFEEVKDVVRAISPVPGGVGPLTVASLFDNVIRAYELQKERSNVL